MEQGGLFQFSVDNALEIIVIFNVCGKILYANQSAMEKLEYEEDIQQCLITDIFPGEFELVSGILTITGSMDGTIQNMMAYRKNRTCFPVRARIFPYENALDYEGQQVYLCTAYDASEKQLMEKMLSQAGQEAEDALKVKNEFVANVTHELRTPVNGILGNTQALMDMETEEEKMKLLRLLERGCRDMNSIINNILDFSKLEAGKFSLEIRKFHFRNMIDYVKANHNNRITEKGLTFTVTVSPEIPEYIIGDELRIVQVLNNLISNAYKFTSVGSIHVEIVKTSRIGNRIELFFMVMDTGIGIAKADQDKLFKSFSQVDASISRKYGGTGLGLNICKQLVEMMGGSIHVESEARRGSTFSFHVWVEISEEDVKAAEATGDAVGGRESYNEGTESDSSSLMQKLQNLTEEGTDDKIWQYGEPENAKELEKKMSKLILSVEMENWEKAEIFADAVKQLVKEAPREVKSAAFRLKMAVQKGDYDKTTAAYETLRSMI